MASSISQEWKASKIRTAPSKHAKQSGTFNLIIYQRALLKKAGVLQNLIIVKHIVVLAMKRLKNVKKVSKFFDI